jgi:hypothetical protein
VLESAVNPVTLQKVAVPKVRDAFATQAAQACERRQLRTDPKAAVKPVAATYPALGSRLADHEPHASAYVVQRPTGQGASITWSWACRGG